jgi:hypothetical protein
MGVATTHYCIFGVMETDKKKVKEFFSLNEKHLDFMDGYDDNGYKDEVTPNESGIHVIVDGMNGGYVVIGKIMFKSLEGFPLEEMLKIKQPKAKEAVKIAKEITKIDQKLGTNFMVEQEFPTFGLYFFTHWH